MAGPGLLSALKSNWERFRKELQEQSRTESTAICWSTSRTQQAEVAVGRSRQQLESSTRLRSTGCVLGEEKKSK